MTKRHWKNAVELEPAPNAAPKRRDEFGPDVARAIADLRARHGKTNVSCEAEGNEPVELDRLREQLSEAAPGLNRRGFLQITGAAAVFALAACGKKHPDSVVPWSTQPEGTTVGNPVYYSSTLRDGGQPVGVMVKTYDGRPIKIEGNPDHPLSRGRCDTRTQAALLNLYDPDRLQDGPRHADKAISWDDLDRTIGGALADGGIGLLTGPIDSPAQKRLIADLGAAFKGRFRHAVLEAFPRRAEARARELAFGDATLPFYRADNAQVMVSFGDFLGGGTTGLAEQIEFGDLRRLKGEGKSARAGQVIAFEPTMSQLGTCADVRVRASSDQLATVAWAIAAVVAKQTGMPLPAAANAALGSAAAVEKALAPVQGAAEPSPIAFAAARLLEAKQAGKNSLVWAGAANQQGEDSISLHLAVAFLNSALGNEGVTVVTPAKERAALADNGSAAQLLEAAATGDVATLVVWNCNPVHIWPASAEKLKKAKTLVVLADRLDETAALAAYVAPTLHGLESWGDAEARPGVYSLQQPCILPLWDCRAAEESLLSFAVAAGAKDLAVDKAKPTPGLVSVVSRRALWEAAAAGVLSWQEYLRRGWVSTIRGEVGAAADERQFWNGALAKGVVVVAPKSTAARGFSAGANAPAPAAAQGLQLVLSASRTMRDGACLNNAWLQELPDPVSKICWDGYLAMSPTDAADQGIAANDVVSLTVGAATVKVPVHVQEGQHPGTLELFLGWGRERAGRVADLAPEHDGYRVNAFALVATRPLPLSLPASIAKTGEIYVLANPQGHDFTENRPIALDEVQSLRGRDLEEAELWRNGTDGKPGGDISMFRTHHVYPGHRWGMTVDMNTCIGCNACVVACIAENNIPVVGRDEVRKGRILHWIRIDRYYSGTFDENAQGVQAVKKKPAQELLDVEVVNQPMLCQQCENAPCEAVCPANATMHNQEGISLQVYNRCVGTRYCANNCPYKVRRFNWYQYSDYRAGPVNAGKPMERIVTNLRTSGSTSSSEELTHAPLEMLLNPEVTVRHRGVMEKCNFCIQRTRTIRDREHAENRRFRDGEITTACAQTCPTKALVFGDISDPQAEVSRMAARTGTAYKVLDEALNTRPSIAYLKRVRVRPATAEDEGQEQPSAKPGAPATMPERARGGEG